MNSQATGSGLVGYNVQSVVDARHHLIVAHEVTNSGNDRGQLSKMAKGVRPCGAHNKKPAEAGYGALKKKPEALIKRLCDGVIQPIPTDPSRPVPKLLVQERFGERCCNQRPHCPFRKQLR